ncbi:iron ABC transporter permease [Halalkalibacterium halodurans]|uniref:Probable heme-iron transport system permease protein IsdF n=1 Tax=Halalkalibacterium halodurans (strain ATCC BAA-125 / DSM 18197 / FERM 7344 / JCM 9153 / C-125) TaxID=272558 RepID=Q9K7R3_HALH5|nr:iron ABC transporter permease [Halalkalibacterium halodurans]MDY7223830.1 iron ABC transporter permease [Halalkalibacterium halodurans]MDY7243051.1 iron ABC transporter permease [Halalkalibacterium halodurans]MED4079953.1 iron ABC transporter permease [Halalkalibacterium halodurans]MED4084475.1 iron ABC transporter permease [Halalkalibacterium halodurans]MED4104929.1 iron ABC transporter permease [Halalkalibacterium halodurans]
MTKKLVSFIVVLLLLIFVAGYSAVTGSIQVSIGELIQGLISGTNEEVQVVKDLRLPRIIISMFAGAALAVSGVLLQAVLRNPLAEAGIIGISSGAGFTSILLVSIFPTLYFWSPLFAFIGGALACFLVYSFSWRSGLSPIKMILVGVALNAVFSGLSDTFNYRGSYTVTSISPTTTSTLSMKTWTDVEIMVTFASVGLILAVFFFSSCNLLVLQDKTAKNLGVAVMRSRLIVSAIAVLLAAVSTAVAGMIAFIGLLIPHIARQLVGSDHKWLIPFSAVAGALLLLVADTLGRSIIAPNEIPASIIMSIIGGPFLIFLIRKGEKANGHS